MSNFITIDKNDAGRIKEVLEMLDGIDERLKKIAGGIKVELFHFAKGVSRANVQSIWEIFAEIDLFLKFLDGTVWPDSQTDLAEDAVTNSDAPSTLGR